MPLRLDIKRKLSNRSERVKAVDFHPTEPWLLTALYNGNVHIWNMESQEIVKTFEITDLPVRAAKFIARKSWIVTGSDDMQVRVFNYNTHEKVITFDAHADYIRTIAVHDTQPYILTGSDDATIKLWDWEKSWRNTMTFEGHAHYVMHVMFNPKDANTFASASMDRTVKIWSLGSSVANYTLEGHQKGVNCVGYYFGGDKPYLVSGADDKLVKVWDYQNKACVQTLEGHTNNVTVVSYHPDLPIIITGSEDGTIRIWHANTYRLENTLNYGMERVWALGMSLGSNDIAFGYDEGTISIKIGREEPAISMDNSGKIIWAKHNEIQTANIKASSDEPNYEDGDKIVLPVKDLGSCEIYPQTLQHSPNGRFVVVCGDGEYIIYTALAWRNKSFGQALEFVWALDSNEYAIRESSSKIKVFKSFKEKNVFIKSSFSAEGIFGGALLGVRSSNFLIFYDWETGSPVRRVDVVARQVYWSESDIVAIASDDAVYFLKFNRLAYQAQLDAGGHDITEDGYEEAFDFVAEIPESVKTGAWIGDCFIYSNGANRLNYVVGDQVSTISHFDYPVYVLGYISRDNRVYVCDKNLSVTSYAVPLSVIEYQTAVIRNDFAAANQVLPNIPKEQRNRIARFLEGRGLKEEALHVTMDMEHRFELAIGLNKLEMAYKIAETLDHDHKWKSIGELALASWNFGLAEESMKRAQDLDSLLLIYQTSGNAQGLDFLANLAVEKGQFNVAFVCRLLRGETEACIDLLIKSNRIPEAALFARTYVPSQVSRVVKLWQESLVKAQHQKAAELLAIPEENGKLFEDYSFALLAEEAFKRQRQRAIPAAEYNDWKASQDWDIISELKTKFPNGPPAIKPSAAPSAPSSPEKKPQPSPKIAFSPEPPKVIPSPTPSPAILKPDVPVQPVPQQKAIQSPSVSPTQPSRPSSSPSPVSQTASLPSKPATPLSNGHGKVQQLVVPSPTLSLGSPAGVSPQGPVKSISSVTVTPRSVPHVAAEEEKFDFASDNMSHLSLEVNTTGTGSLTGDIDLDDFAAFPSDIPAGEVGTLDDDEIDKLLS